jgi:hypothetical protein
VSVGDSFGGWPPAHGPNGSPIVSVRESRDLDTPEYIHRIDVLCADGSRAKATGDGKIAGTWVEMSPVTFRGQVEARGYVLAKERCRNWGQPEFEDRYDALLDVLEERLK